MQSYIPFVNVFKLYGFCCCFTNGCQRQGPTPLCVCLIYMGEHQRDVAAQLMVKDLLSHLDNDHLPGYGDEKRSGCLIDNVATSLSVKTVFTLMFTPRTNPRRCGSFRQPSAIRVCGWSVFFRENICAQRLIVQDQGAFLFQNTQQSKLISCS